MKVTSEKKVITETSNEIETRQNGLSDVNSCVLGEVPNEDFVSQEDSDRTSGDESRQEVSTSMRILTHPKHQQRFGC